MFGDGDRSGLPGHIDYEELLAAERPGFSWPEIDEYSAAAMCYTSGTTGQPKGVVYSHRSTFLHSLGVCSGEALGLSQYDRLLPVVPMFHGNAWGMPYAGWLVGADLLLPNRFTQAAPLARFIAAERATVAMAVPTVWYDVLGLDPGSVDLASLRMIMCGGAAVPRSLIESYEQRYGVRIVQGWGLTETSPVAALSFPPKNVSAERAMDYRATAGRPLGGVEARIVDDEGKPLPRDGRATGEIEVRGPWVTAAYYKDPTPDKFRDGWLRTGDVGRIDARGFITISDRAKDMVKSGGEWISTLELESAILTHPAVREAAVIAAPDQRWGERPLACIVRAPGQSVTAAGAPGAPVRPGGQVVAARPVGVRGRGAPHQRGQARQEAPQGAPRRRPPRRRDQRRHGRPDQPMIRGVHDVRSRYRRHRPDADRPGQQGLADRPAARRPGCLRRRRGAQADPAARPRPDRRPDLRLRAARR